MLEFLVDNCRSIRSFDESRPVSREELLSFVDIARKTASAANRQPVKYRLITGEECKKVQPLTAWAGALPDWELPPKGKMPTAFILMCHDTAVSPVSDYAAMDIGIAAQTLALAAAEQGIGCCMIGSFKSEICDVLGIGESLVPRLLLAFGYPAETVLLCEPREGSVTYFRDDAGVHFVPKRTLPEVIIPGGDE
ncbi:MAG: nitroreductase family protein [Ruminococcaceae bacterium]|nr:nitroreductase family protein [Oscillospiraceae bacterium]